jgi:hypothetical protein
MCKINILFKICWRFLSLLTLSLSLSSYAGGTSQNTSPINSELNLLQNDSVQPSYHGGIGGTGVTSNDGALVTRGLKHIGDSQSSDTGFDLQNSPADILFIGPISSNGEISLDGTKTKIDIGDTKESSIPVVSKKHIGQWIVAKINKTTLGFKVLSLKFLPHISGPITNINKNGHLEVMGQQVTPPLDTDISNFHKGDYIDVSGFKFTSNSLIATHIQKRQNRLSHLLGYVSDKNAEIFTVSGVKVNFEKSLVNNDIQIGQFVEVSGNYLKGALKASKITLNPLVVEARSAKMVVAEGPIHLNLSTHHPEVHGIIYDLDAENSPAIDINYAQVVLEKNESNIWILKRYYQYDQ